MVLHISSDATTDNLFINIEHNYDCDGNSLKDVHVNIETDDDECENPGQKEDNK